MNAVKRGGNDDGDDPREASLEGPAQAGTRRDIRDTVDDHKFAKRVRALILTFLGWIAAIGAAVVIFKDWVADLFK